MKHQIYKLTTTGKKTYGDFDTEEAALKTAAILNDASPTTGYAVEPIERKDKDGLSRAIAYDMDRRNGMYMKDIGIKHGVSIGAVMGSLRLYADRLLGQAGAASPPKDEVRERLFK